MAQTRFNFVGTASIPKADSKRPFVKEIKKGDKRMLSLNFGVKESNSNTGFVELFDGEQKTIRTKNRDNEDIEISWGDRLDKTVISSVSDMRKIVVDLGEELGGRKEFITNYDAIEYLAENLPKYEGKICVTGQMRKDWYAKNGVYYDKFIIGSVYAVPEDRKNRLSIIADFYYNKDSVDKTDWKSEKKIYLDGWIQQYINKDEGTKYVPHRLIFNASKYDVENNEKHKKLLDYKLKYIDITNKKIQHLLWECVLVNGAQEIEFDESQLTKSQLEQIELGIRTLDDFKPRGSIFGERITEYRMFDPKLTGDFSDGLVDTELSMSEFEEEIYAPATDEKLSDVIKEEPKKKEETPSVEDDDLF